MIEVSLFLLTIVLSVVVTLLTQEPIHYVFARFIGGWIPRQTRDIRGLWLSTHTYEHDANRKANHVVELRQFGKYFTGKFLTGEQQRLRGKIQFDTYITGVWQIVERGNIYHGAFQFVIMPNGKIMKGQWLGFRKNLEVQHGNWTLEFKTSEIDTDSKQRMIKECVSENNPVKAK